LAEAYLEAGELALALEQALEAVMHAEKTGSPGFKVAAHKMAMEAILARSDLRGDSTVRDAAHRHLEAAVAILNANQDEAAQGEIALLKKRFADAAANS
jgi:hypothetical protein